MHFQDSHAMQGVYTLSEVCARCEVPEHVLVYWSDFFRRLKDESGHLKTAFSEEDLELIVRVKKCLYARCMTVQEAVREIAEQEKSVPRVAEQEAPSAPVIAVKAESPDKEPLMPTAPIFAVPPQVSAAPEQGSFSDLMEGGLKHLEEAISAQKNRFENRLTDQNAEFSAVRSECAARMSDLTTSLGCEQEKNRRLTQLIDQVVKDLEALRIEVFGDK